MDIHDLRRSYEESSLDFPQLKQDPVAQFELWFAAAQSEASAAWFEVNAMTLATADLQGRVSARIVLLKHFSQAGFTFFTNYDSDKGRQLQENPQASLVFYWPHIERQVRIEGVVERTDNATSDEYFHARPHGSQLGAVASPQSRPLPAREPLEQAVAELDAKYAAGQVPRPDFWGGYILKPSRVEFWQGRPSRLHDRFVYIKSGAEQWQISRLAP